MATGAGRSEAMATDLPQSSASGGAGLVVAATVGNMLSVTPSIISTFGLFLVPIATEFGWPRSVVSGALAIVLLGNALGSAPAGRLADRFGARRIILAGNVLLAVAIGLLAFTGASHGLFYLQFLLVGVIGALASNMVIAKLLADAFDKRRGLLIGIAGGIGNGVGSAVLPALVAVMLITHSWREAYLGLGLVTLAVGFPILYLLIRTPAVEKAEQQGIPAEGMTLGEAVRTPMFWLLATSVPLGGGCLQALFATIEPFLVDRGLSIGAGTTVLVLFALTCAIWEPTVGMLLDRTRRPLMLAPCYLTGAVGLLLLILADQMALLMLAGVLLGIALGAEFSAVTFLLSRYFGRHALGAISGTIFGIALLVSAAAAVLLNICYDLTGSYFAGLLAIVPLLAWNGIAILALPHYRFMGPVE